MKAFIWSLIVFSLLCGSIAVYEFILTKNAEEINRIAAEVTEAIKREDIDGAMKGANALSEKWESLENMLMAFNDHKEINEMTQKLYELHSFGGYKDFREMRCRIDSFSQLFNYAIDSTKPTISNIF